MVFGVVCEFNPFHEGHKYLFERARELGTDSLVCVMSGNATQRGELAVADKYVRSEAALREGVMTAEEFDRVYHPERMI